MVINETTQILANITNSFLSDSFSGIISKTSFLITIFQAIGGAILLYILFQIISLFLTRKKTREITRIREILEEINKKLEKLLKKK